MWSTVTQRAPYALAASQMLPPFRAEQDCMADEASWALLPERERSERERSHHSQGGRALADG
jgi:hypothetical protein